ncbi:MAG: PAS domain S-box protein [Gammaproteobacteria bacterium]|nr:PAS domain S-box protein [Gammaproteobacteria bacterium]
MNIEEELLDFGEVADGLLNEVYIFDIKSLYFISVNKAATHNTGYTAEEFKLLTPLDLKIQYIETDFKGLLALLLEGKKKQIIFETIHKRKNGSQYLVEVYIQVSLYRSQPVFVATIHDITEREKTYQSLKEKRLSAILNNAIESIISIDCNAIIEDINPATVRIFGYEKAELIGKNIKLLIPSPWHHKHDEYIKNYLATGIKKIIGIGREVSGQRKDGSIFPIDLSIGEVVFDGKHSFTGIIRDISDRKLAEEEFKLQEEEIHRNREQFSQLSRISAVGELAASIAHEINQPLTAIGSYAQACVRLAKNKDRLVDNEEFLSSIDKISEQTQRAAKVIQHLRSLINKHDVQYELVDVNDLISEVIELSRTRLLSAKINIEITPLSQSLLIECDPIQIQQVLLNLINNAIDSICMSDFGKRKIIIRTLYETAKTTTNAILVSVRDFGEGVTQKDRAGIFSSFVTNKAHGMGVGLSISRSIIEAHGGDLYLNNDINHGAEFYFTLPVVIRE